MPASPSAHASGHDPGGLAGGSCLAAEQEFVDPISFLNQEIGFDNCLPDGGLADEEDREGADSSGVPSFP